MIRRSNRFAATIALWLLIAAPAGANEVCVEFLENHPTDPAWLKACIAALEAAEGESSSQSASSSSSAAMQASATLTVGDIENMSNGQTVEGGDGQPEVFIAVDPNDPDRRFGFSKTDPPFFDRMFASVGTGGTWDPRQIATAIDNIPQGKADPWAIFDPVGNLWIAYLGNVDLGNGEGGTATHVARSTDGGQTFETPIVASIGPKPFPLPSGSTDRPALAIGPDPGGVPGGFALWVIYRIDGPMDKEIRVQGLRLDAQGEIVDICPTALDAPFCPAQTIGTAMGEALIPGSLVVGPQGQVLASFMRTIGGAGETSTTGIYLAFDPDGLGPGMFVPDPMPAFTTNATILDNIPPMPGISPFPALAWDHRTNDARPAGRVHVIYTSEDTGFSCTPNPCDGLCPTATESHDTNIVARHSDDFDPATLMSGSPAAASWTPELRVNDDPVPTNPSEVHSQFFPFAAVDPASGMLGVAWYDTRNDPCVSPAEPGNRRAQLFATVSVDRGETFLPNVQVSSHFSNGYEVNGTDYGDYIGVAAQDFALYPAWADNSNETCDNPDHPNAPNSCDGFGDPIPTASPLPMDPYTTEITLGPDTDTDSLPDPFDACLVDPRNANPGMHCDSDGDGYANVCDGDFDGLGSVNATDFSDYFLPDFQTGMDSGVGTDMDCGGSVNAADFSQFFVPQFENGGPGPSGLYCAGDPDCQ